MSNSSYRRKSAWPIYFVLLMLCAGAYVLYQQFVVPMVEVTTPIRRAPEHDQQEYDELPDNTDHWQWFQEGDWERSPCNILLTDQGKILFDDFRREDDKTWHVFPFSLVLDGSGEPSSAASPSGPPLVLRCERGATLRFDRPVMANINSSGNSLQSASLKGQVELYRLATHPTRNDAIRIETSNVQITEDQILTIDDVAFWLGGNQGIGRNLSIELSHNSPENSLTKDFSKISGIRKIQLGFLSSMRLKPGSSSAQRAGRQDRLLSTDSTPVEIKAAGPFEFDMTTNLARFQDHIQVKKLDSFEDTLHCDELQLKFKSDGAEVIKLDATERGRFELESITALGRAGSPAIIRGYSQDAQVIAERLHYDIAQQTISASGGQQVEVTQGSNQFVSQTIDYRLTDDRTLGPLIAHGPGQLRRQDGENTFRALWSKSLRLRRESEQQHTVALEGNTELHLDAETSIRADFLEFRLWEVPVFNNHSQFVRWTYQPSELVANQNVHIAAETMMADTKTVRAHWPQYPQAAPIEIAQAGGRPPQSPPRRTVVRRPPLQDAAIFPKKKSRPLRIRSEAINVTVAEHQKKTAIVDVTMDGNVRVKKPDDLDPRRSEFEISGNHLHLTPGDNESYKIRIEGTNGQYAQVVSEQMNLSGREISLDQIKNLLWVNGQGQLELKTQSLQSSPQASSYVVQKALDANVNIDFVGGMIFDGRQVYFERQVEAVVRQQEPSGQATITDGRGAALVVTLDRNFDFTNLGKSPSSVRPQIVDLIIRDDLPQEKIQFKGRPFEQPLKTTVVLTRQTTDAIGKATEKFTVAARHAVLNQATQDIIAYGPGSVQMVRRDAGGRKPTGLGVANRARPRGSNQLTYIHTKFDGKLTANTITNELVVTGNLRSLYTPVQNVQQTFDPDQTASVPVGTVLLNCQRIEMTQKQDVTTGTPLNQLIASGGAHIRSDTFDSKAHQIVYQEEGDLLVVESSGGRNVVLKYRRDASAAWKKLVGQRLLYHVSSQTGRAEKVGHISATINNRP